MYKNNGQRVNVIETLSDGRYLVQNISLVCDEYGEEFEIDGSLEIIKQDKLHSDEPTASISSDMKNIQEARENLVIEKRKLLTENSDLSMKICRKKEKLEKLVTTSEIYDYIDKAGKKIYTHVLYYARNCRDWNITQVQYNNSLYISLSSGKPLYKEYSGYQDIKLFKGEQKAKDHLSCLLTKQISNIDKVNYRSFRATIEYALNAIKKFSLPVDTTIIDDIVKKIKEENQESKYKEMKKEIEDKQKRLDNYKNNSLKLRAYRIGEGLE